MTVIGDTDGGRRATALQIRGKTFDGADVAYGDSGDVVQQTVTLV